MCSISSPGGGTKAGLTTGACAAPPQGREFSFAIQPLPGEGMMEMFDRLAVALKEKETMPAHLMVFGSVRARPAADEAMRRVFGRMEWPVSWMEGAAHGEHPIAGVEAFAFAAGRVTPVTLHGRVVGSVFEEDGIRHCLLGGLGPDSLDTSRPDQFRQTLGNMEAALEQAGFALGDVVRTWFYLDDLLSWYGAFNEVRTAVYDRISFRSGSLPASTGISARNPAGTALVAAVRAMRPLHSAARAVEVPSPLQCPARAYGSSFSRAMEIVSPHGRRLLISGTAGISPGGRTLWPGNLRRQMESTMEVVEALLVSRGFGFSDITRATAYFKHRADIPALAAWRSLLSPSAIASECGICRDDLLFELEADAWRETPAM